MLRVAQAATTVPRVVHLDNIRYLMVVLVVFYHAVAAYAALAPDWAIRDTFSTGADVVRALGDVFLMPVLFFVAGYFALYSLQKKGAWSFLKDKVRRIAVPWVPAVLALFPLVLYFKSDRVTSFGDMAARIASARQVEAELAAVERNAKPPHRPRQARLGPQIPGIVPGLTARRD